MFVPITRKTLCKTEQKTFPVGKALKKYMTKLVLVIPFTLSLFTWASLALKARKRKDPLVKGFLKEMSGSMCLVHFYYF